ncbi:alpha/beta fold hydrolase [Fodinicola feengrottensis]|uniref:Alpha/beta fold hydrolase n=1 Tax=Fodinicola feengrottensis TaxID=435914 RepID=A0ABP4RUX0_9ACTN
MAAVVAVVVGGLLASAAPAAAATRSSGFDDWSCRPSSTRPDPVVLIHGLGGNGPGNFATIGPALAAAGYCAYTTTYGQASAIPVGGTIAIADSAVQLTAFIDRVRQSTGASKVDLVGHSEGAFQSLYIPKVLGYSGRIHRVVALAPPTHGTTFAGLVNIAYLLGARDLVGQVLTGFGCPACNDLITGGPAVARLNAGRISQPGVDYTIIASRSDELVTPTSTAFVAESGVHNAYVQNTCPLDPVGHVGLAFDSDVTQMIKNALDPTHPGRVFCSFGLPL